MLQAAGYSIDDCKLVPFGSGRGPNADRKACEQAGGTVIFPNSGGWYCDKAK